VPAHEAAEAGRVEPDPAGVVRDVLAPPPQAGAGVAQPKVRRVIRATAAM
jgi:hypothetical protein